MTTITVSGAVAGTVGATTQEPMPIPSAPTTQTTRRTSPYAVGAVAFARPRRLAVRRDPTVLTEALGRVRGLAQLSANWDGEDAVPIASGAITHAELLLREVICKYPLLDRSLRPFFLIGRPDGGVQVEWRVDSRSVEVDVRPDGQLSYLFVDRSGEAPRFHENASASRSEAIDVITHVAIAPYRA